MKERAKDEAGDANTPELVGEQTDEFTVPTVEQTSTRTRDHVIPSSYGASGGFEPDEVKGHSAESTYPPAVPDKA